MIVKPNLYINNDLLFDEAKKLRLPVKFFKEINALQIQLGGRNYYIHGYGMPFNSGSVTEVSDDKYLVNQLLQQAKIPVAKAICITKKMFNDYAWHLGELKYPLVAKPTCGTWGGEGVLCNISTRTMLQLHLEECFKRYDLMSIEEYHGGLKSYRVFVLENKVLALLERKPPQVIGDGKNTIEKLMAIENVKRKRYVGKLPVADLQLDDEYRIRLDELNLTVQSVPKKGEVIELCYRVNSLAGGSTIGLKTSQICKENVDLILHASKVLNLNAAGYDIACEDISKPIGANHTKGIIIEVNNPSDLTLHEWPISGPQNHVARKMLKKLIRKHLFSYTMIRIKSAFGLMPS